MEDVIRLRSTISSSRNNPVFTTLLKYVRFCRRYSASRQITHLHPRIQWFSCMILCMYMYAHPSIIFAFSSQGRLVSSSKASPIPSRRFLPSRKDTVKSSICRSEGRTRSVSCGNSLVAISADFQINDWNSIRSINVRLAAEAVSVLRFNCNLRLIINIPTRWLDNAPRLTPFKSSFRKSIKFHDETVAVSENGSRLYISSFYNTDFFIFPV